MIWSQERIADLKQRWAAKENARQIGAAIGMSRNAVLGKIHRLGLSERINRKPKAARAREQKIAARGNQSLLKNVMLARARAIGELPAYEAVELPQEQITHALVALIDLEPHHCRWPIEQDGTTMFCGADKHAGAYCEAHARIAYRPLIERIPSDEARYRGRRLAARMFAEGKWTKKMASPTTIG